MGCTHSTPIPSKEDLAKADHSTQTKGPYLLEHSNSQATLTPSVNIDGGDGTTYSIRISGSTISLLKDDKSFEEAPLKVEFGKHFPGYIVKLLDDRDNLVAIMIPLYRPGRPTIKIYTGTPAFEGQEPTKSQKPEQYGTLYSWAEWRAHYALGGCAPGATFALNLESSNGKVPAFVAKRAGAVCNPWTQQLVTNASNQKPAAHLQHVDDFEWNVFVSPNGVDPVLMICMALMTEQLAKTQKKAHDIQRNPNLVFKM